MTTATSTPLRVMIWAPSVQAWLITALNLDFASVEVQWAIGSLCGDGFFFGGDVSEVVTLIDVDDAFALGCAEVIRRVSESVKNARPGIFH